MTGDAWLARDPFAIRKVIAGFAGFLRLLHALPIEECPFNSGAAGRLSAARRLVAAGMVDTEVVDDDHAGWTAGEMLAEATRLSIHATGAVVTHGDISLGNLLFDADGMVTGCIDVGRLGIADPYQDIAILWQNLAEFGADAQTFLVETLAIGPLDPGRLAFHRCLDELF